MHRYEIGIRQFARDLRGRVRAAGVSRKWLVPLMLFVQGCTSMGPPYVEEQAGVSESLIYIYRADRVSKRVDSAPGISINGKPVGDLLLDGYLVAKVNPGPVVVSMTTNPYLWPVGSPLKTTRFEAKAGQTYFVEFGVNFFDWQNRNIPFGTHSVITIGAALQPVDKATAQTYLPKLRRSN